MSASGGGRLQAQQLTPDSVVNNLGKLRNSKIGELSLAKWLEKFSNNAVTVDLAAGTVGGLAQILVGQPFDAMKVQMQSSTQITSPIDSARSILGTQGPRGFYRGMMAPLAMVASQNAILFSSTGVIKRALRPDGGILNPSEAAFTGAVAGIPVALVATPTELLKCRLQAQGASRPPLNITYTLADVQARKVLYNGPIDAIKLILRFEGGLLGLFKGFTPTLTREIIGNAAYFGTYSLVKTTLATTQGLDSSRSLGTGSLMVAGGIAGATFWLPIIPADTIKTRMQLQSPYDPHRYSSMLDCARQIIKNEGFGSLFKGWQPCLARSVPANAALFVAMEATQSFLSPV
jgi:solute carrier family 25 carnitine/acylcarnitine transporter 20/29